MKGPRSGDYVSLDILEAAEVREPAQPEGATQDTDLTMEDDDDVVYLETRAVPKPQPKRTRPVRWNQIIARTIPTNKKILARLLL